MKGVTYARLTTYCNATKVSISGFIEEVVAERLDLLAVPEPDAPPPSYPESKHDDDDATHFTF